MGKGNVGNCGHGGRGGNCGKGVQGKRKGGQQGKKNLAELSGSDVPSVYFPHIFTSLFCGL